MLCFVALGVLGPQTRLASAVYEPAIRLENLGNVISRETGEPVTVSPELKDVVVFVRVADQPVSNLLDAVCHVARADWQKDARGYHIFVSAKTRAVQANAQKQTLRAGISRFRAELAEDEYTKERVEKAITEVNKLVRLRGRERFRALDRILALERYSPSQRFVMELLASLPAEEVLNICGSPRTVYATEPTSLQKPIAEPKGRLRKLNERQAIVWSALKNTNPSVNDDISFIFSPNLLRPASDGSNRAASALIVFKASSFGPQFEVSLQDDKGRDIRTEKGDIYLGEQADTSTPNSIFGNPDGDVVVTGDERQSMAWRPGMALPTEAEIPTILRVLRSADRLDPLSVAAGKLLAPITAGKQLVCILGDWLSPSFGKQSSVSLATALKIFSTDWFTSEQISGIQCVRTRTLQTSAASFPREKLAFMARKVGSEGFLSLGDVAQLASNANGADGSELVAMGLTLSGQIGGTPYRPDVCLPLQTFNLLSESQKEAAWSPEGCWIELGSGHSELKTLLIRAVFDETPFGGFSEHEVKELDITNDAGPLTLFGGVSNNEPTTILSRADSKPWRARVTLRNVARLAVNDPGGAQHDARLETYESVVEEFANARWQASFTPGQQPDYPEVVLGKMACTIIGVEFRFGHYAPRGQSFILTQQPVTGLLPFEALKEPLKSEFQQSVQRRFQEMLSGKS